MRIAAYTCAANEVLFAGRWAKTTEQCDHRLWLCDRSDIATIEAARSHGITVEVVDYETLGGFRFDHARNLALNALPDDIDVCVSLDADEILDDGFIPALRAAPPADKWMPWFDTGTWWRADRVHTRHGWEWRVPCHEVTEWTGEGVPRVAPLEAKMYHRPDNDKPRASYLPLLKLAVDENPADARVATYYARQLWFDRAPADDIIAAVERALGLTGWSAERAFLCRIGANVWPDQGEYWLRRGAQEWPREAEAWHALAKYYYERQNWAECLEAALTAASCPVATSYLSDQAARSWGSWDLAAIAAHNLGHHDNAVEHGYKAWAANPDDGRLLANLAFYVAGQGIPTYAVIPTIRSRPDELTNLVEALEDQGVEVVVMDGDAWLGDKWADALKWVAGTTGTKRWNVVLINDDVAIGPNFAVVLAAALRSAPDVGLAHPGDAPAGWCMGLRGEDRIVPDANLKWWFGDNDLHRQIEAAGLRLITCAADAVHLHPNEATAASPVLQAQAELDRVAFDAKWATASAPG